MSRRKKELANIAEEKSFIIVEMKKKGTETNLQLIWLLIDVPLVSKSRGKVLSNIHFVYIPNKPRP